MRPYKPSIGRTVHPGAILREELEDLGISPTELARQIDVPANRISQILSSKRSITGDTALRLGHWFGTNPQFWMNLQTQYDIAVAMRDSGAAIARLPTRDMTVPDVELVPPFADHQG